MSDKTEKARRGAAGHFVRTTWIAAALVFANGSAQAEVAIPEGCTPIATVLKTECHATTLMECGARREAHGYKDGELLVVHEYSPAWELIEFRYAGFSGASMTAVPGTVANMQIETLLETGRSEESGEFLMNTGMIKDRSYTLSGHIELTGETVELGNTQFQKALITRLFETKPGAGGMVFTIDMYVSPERDVLVEADWTRSVFDSETELFNQTPYHLAWPGEDGFLADKPEQGCE